MPLDAAPEIVPSTCPHDCPSACALDVERLDARTIRPGPRREEQPLHRRSRLRQGRPLRRARAPSGPTDAPAAPRRRQGRRDRGVRPDRLGRGSRRGRGPSEDRGRRMGQRVGLALFLRRHDGARAARRDRPSAPRHALCAPALHLLRRARRRRMARRGRREVRHGFARDAGRRPDRRLGRQPGEHPSQRDDPYRAGAEEPGGKARGRRSLPHRYGGTGGPASGAQARHRRGARLRRHARPVPRRLRGPGVHGGIRRLPGRSGSPSAIPRTRLGPPASQACPPTRSRPSPRSTDGPSAPICASATALPARATARPTCTP